MPLILDCPCGKKLKIPEHLWGKRVRCPACGKERATDPAGKEAKINTQTNTHSSTTPPVPNKQHDEYSEETTYPHLQDTSMYTSVKNKPRRLRAILLTTLLVVFAPLFYMSAGERTIEINDFERELIAMFDAEYEIFSLNYQIAECEKKIAEINTQKKNLIYRDPDIRQGEFESARDFSGRKNREIENAKRRHQDLWVAEDRNIQNQRQTIENLKKKRDNLTKDLKRRVSEKYVVAIKHNIQLPYFDQNRMAFSGALLVPREASLQARQLKDNRLKVWYAIHWPTLTRDFSFNTLKEAQEFKNNVERGRIEISVTYTFNIATHGFEEVKVQEAGTEMAWDSVAEDAAKVAIMAGIASLFNNYQPPKPIKTPNYTRAAPAKFETMYLFGITAVAADHQTPVKVRTLTQNEWSWGIEYGLFNDDVWLSNKSDLEMTNITLLVDINLPGGKKMPELKLDRLGSGKTYNWINVLSIPKTDKQFKATMLCDQNRR